MSKKYQGLVEILRKNGYTVGISHFRYAVLPAKVEVGGLTFELETQVLCLCTKHTDLTAEEVGVPVISPSQASPNGGATRVRIVSPEGETFETEAFCSLLDNYSKRLGVRIALQRYLSSEGLGILRNDECNASLVKLDSKVAAKE